MTDKAKLEEIKKLADAMYYAAFNLTTDASLLRKAMEEYHQFIIHEYFQEEPVSDDLEKASTKYAQDKYMPVQTSQAFKAGANWQKEQMMKDAVDGWVFRDIKEGKLRISDNKECWNGIRIPEKSIEKSYLFCTTDDAIKVKLVITKED